MGLVRVEVLRRSSELPGVVHSGWAGYGHARLFERFVALHDR